MGSHVSYLIDIPTVTRLGLCSSLILWWITTRRICPTYPKPGTLVSACFHTFHTSPVHCMPYRQHSLHAGPVHRMPYRQHSLHAGPVHCMPYRQHSLHDGPVHCMSYRQHAFHTSPVHCIMITSSNGNIFRVIGHLCGDFTGHRWIPRTKASDAELWCFLWSAPE